MSSRGHKRAASYFSGFTVSDGQSNDSNQNEATPAESKPAILEDRKQQIEAELDLRVQTLRGHRKYNSVTLPLSVKFSVTGEVPNKQPQLAFVSSSSSSSKSSMARPRSPQKKHDLARDKAELLLDQTLISIRQKLGLLSTERQKMEQQMEVLANGIKEARVQCGRRRRLSSQNSSTALRRVSSSVSPGKNFRKTSLIPEETDGASIDDGTCSRSSTSTSKESLRDSPVLGAHKGSFSDSMNSTHSAPAKLYHRERAATVSTDVRVQQEDSELFVSNWLANTTIPELPESPNPIRSSPPSTHVTSSPKRFIFQSSPNLQGNRRDIHSRPSSNASSRSSNRNSLPESILSQVRSQDNLDTMSYDNLSQVSNCTDEGSPRLGSTVILRRSSLTGQLEHFRNPKAALVKRNSSFNTPTEKSLLSVTGFSPLSCSFGSLSDASRGERKNYSGHSQRKMRKRQQSVFLPSIETTV